MIKIEIDMDSWQFKFARNAVISLGLAVFVTFGIVSCCNSVQSKNTAPIVIVRFGSGKDQICKYENVTSFRRGDRYCIFKTSDGSTHVVLSGVVTFLDK